MTTEILHLSFRLMTEKTFSHSMDSSLLISDVKALIETDSEIAPENQRLIFKGQLLKDEYTLQSYGLKSGNTIHVVGRVAAPTNISTNTSSDIPDNIIEPDSTNDNIGNNTTNTEQIPGGQTTPGPNTGMGFGFPMGIFMSPIYATISVSGPGNAPPNENTMEQVASQFFSGVVNSLLTSFNNVPGTNTNTPTAGPSPSTSRSQDDELLVDLELSTSVLNRVTRSVKRLNSTPNTHRSTNNNNNNQFNHNINTSGTESLDSVGEFNNLAYTTGNVDHDNFRSRHGSSTSTSNITTINLDRINQNDTDNESCKYVYTPEYEEFEGCGGKVLLINPEVLSSKLPWDSLNKLEQVLFEHTNMIESNVDFDDNNNNNVHQGFVVTEEYIDNVLDTEVIEIDNNNITNNNTNDNINENNIEVQDYLEPLNPEDYEFKFEDIKVDNLEEHNQYVNQKENNNKQQQGLVNKDNIEEITNLEELEMQNNNNNTTNNTTNNNNMNENNNNYNNNKKNKEIYEDNEINNIYENNNVDGPQVIDITEENESLGYEDFMRKFHKYELKLTEIMRDYNLGDKDKQLNRFKQLSSAMAIKTRIDASLCALFSWMQNQMVSTERARQFATHMGWNTMTNNNNNTMTSTSSETQINENQGNITNNNMNSNNNNNNYNNNSNSNTSGMTFSTSPTNTTTFTSNIPGVGEVTLQVPVGSSGVTVSSTRINTNNTTFTQNNPFNVTTTNPFVTTQSSTFSPFSSSDSSTVYNNNTTNNNTNNNNNMNEDNNYYNSTSNTSNSTINNTTDNNTNTNENSNNYNNNTNTNNTQTSEIQFQQTTSGTSSTESGLNTSNQSDLFIRYRSNPDFESSMARMRQTKLSDSYHSS